MFFLDETRFLVQVCTLFFSCFQNITAKHNFEVLPVNKQQQKSDVKESCSMFVQPWQSKVKTSIEVKYVLAMPSQVIG